MVEICSRCWVCHPKASKMSCRTHPHPLCCPAPTLSSPPLFDSALAIHPLSQTTTTTTTLSIVITQTHANLAAIRSSFQRHRRQASTLGAADDFPFLPPPPDQSAMAQQGSSSGIAVRGASTRALSSALRGAGMSSDAGQGMDVDGGIGRTRGGRHRRSEARSAGNPLDQVSHVSSLSPGA